MAHPNVKVANVVSPDVAWNFKTGRLADHLAGSDFVSSESILMLASPIPTYSQDALNSAVAVALAQDIGFQQQRQFQQVFEIGSRRKYTFSSGRISGSLNLTRMLFDGPSLLKSLTPMEIAEGGEDDFEIVADATDVGDHAGYGEFFINLGSSLFSQPLGIFLVFRDIGNQNVGAVFFQEAYIVAHGMTVSAQQPFIGENVQIVYEGVLPVQHRDGAGLAPTKQRTATTS